MLEQRKSVMSPAPEKDGVAETIHDELTVTPTPRPPVPLEGVDAPEGGHDSVENLCWSRLLAGPLTLRRGAHTGTGFLAGLVTATHGKDPCWISS